MFIYTKISALIKKLEDLYREQINDFEREEKLKILLEEELQKLDSEPKSNPYITSADIDRAKNTLTPRVFREEYELDFDLPSSTSQTLHEPLHLLNPDISDRQQAMGLGDLSL